MSRDLRNRNGALWTAMSVTLAMILGLLCAPRTSQARTSGQQPAANQSAGTQQPASAAPAAPTGPTAAERFKNIQVDPSGLPEGIEVNVSPVASGPDEGRDVETGKPQTRLDRLKQFIGMAKDMPPDSSVNHDHYLHGARKQE